MSVKQAILGGRAVNTPFLLSERVKRTVLGEVYSIKLQEYGVRGLWVEQLKLALKSSFGICHT